MKLEILLSNEDVNTIFTKRLLEDKKDMEDNLKQKPPLDSAYSKKVRKACKVLLDYYGVKSEK
jgi:hypothetical protein